MIVRNRVSIIYYCETWNTANQIKIFQIFINKCLRQIMNMKWTDKITTEKLWRITKQKSIKIQIKRRKWNWTGLTLRKEVGAIEKTALDWNPQGYRRKSRPKRTCRKTIEDEIRSTGRSWNEVKGIAGDRKAWKLFTPQGVKGFDDDNDDRNHSFIIIFTKYPYFIWCRTVILGAFAKLREATISFVIFVRTSVRLPARMEQLGSHWRDFHEIWCLGIFRKSVEKIQVS